jgi:hypothetical protein
LHGSLAGTILLSLDEGKKPKNADYLGFKKILTTLGKNVYSYVDIEAIGVAGTGTGHKRHK